MNICKYIAKRVEHYIIHFHHFVNTPHYHSLLCFLPLPLTDGRILFPFGSCRGYRQKQWLSSQTTAPSFVCIGFRGWAPPPQGWKPWITRSSELYRVGVMRGGGASIFPFLCFLISFHLLSLAGGRESAENSPAKLTKRQKPSEKGDAREIYLRYKPILAGVADNSLSQNFAHLCKAVNIWMPFAFLDSSLMLCCNIYLKDRFLSYKYHRECCTTDNL